ncbi:hypothetical protein FB451DRAFT_974399, partial [Mycena latifolia]
DICLSGRPISHLEQPDDVALFSTTADGLQRKLDLFFGWCRVNFMVISATKTEWMLFGELPTTIPRMMVGDKPIHLVKSYKFVGIIFTSINRDIFATHYTKKASKARAVANTTFAAKSMIGCLPPFDGIRMYDARIDPHLTFGCELSYRRPFLALGYLIYLITLPPNHLANAAYLDSLVLSNSGHPCWITDLQFVLQSLPVPIILSSKELDVDKVVEIRKSVLAACEKWLGNLTSLLTDSLARSSSRLPFIQGRLERNDEGKFVQMAIKFRHYLRVPVPAHRKALTRLLLSSHILAIEILRYEERYR